MLPPSLVLRTVLSHILLLEILSEALNAELVTLSCRAFAISTSGIFEHDHGCPACRLALFQTMITSATLSKLFCGHSYISLSLVM